MIDTMEEYSGIGLAAPQVHESRRVFVAILDPEGQGEGVAWALINPEITLLDVVLVDGW
jgi:peptide deformylase